MEKTRYLLTIAISNEILNFKPMPITSPYWNRLNQWPHIANKLKIEISIVLKRNKQSKSKTLLLPLLVLPLYRQRRESIIGYVLLYLGVVG